METNNRNYLILNVSELNKIDFNQICESSIDTLRFNSDDTKTFIKWESDTDPDFIFNLNSKEGPYNQNEILEILSTDYWKKTTNTMP